MIIVKFTRNPAGNLWIGWAEYQNGTYFASRNTMDHLVYRMKQCLYSKKRVPFSQVYLDTKQSTPDDVPVELMTNMFRSKYWKRGYIEKPISPVNITPVLKPHNDTPKYDYYEYKVKDGRLVVYGIMRREVNSFDLRKTQNEGVNDDRNE